MQNYNKIVFTINNGMDFPKYTQILFLVKSQSFKIKLPFPTNLNIITANMNFKTHTMFFILKTNNFLNTFMKKMKLFLVLYKYW